MRIIRWLFASAVIFFTSFASAFAQTSILDNTFGTNGTVRSYFPSGDSSFDQASGIAIQSDGKIVAAGMSLANASPAGAFALARYDTNGQIDATFGSDGFVRSASDGWWAHAIVIQSDGKIVVVGDANFLNADFGKVGFGVKRFNSDGSLDNTFGTSGGNYVFIIDHAPINNSALDDHANAAAIQSDGKIVVGGEYNDYNNPNGGHLAFALARFDSDGALDSTFGTDGRVMTFIAGGDSTIDVINSIVIQSDGKIVAVGSSYNPFPTSGGVNSIALAGYNFNGTLDNSFGTNGTVRIAVPGGQASDDEGYSAAIQHDGKILVGGFCESSSGPYPSFGTTQFAVLRFNPDGTLDSTFGTGGAGLTYISGGDSVDDQAYALALQPNGKIVLAGDTFFRSGNDKYAFAVARFDSDGVPDNTFASHGSTLTVFPGGDSTDDEARAVAIQPDGKIVAAGYSFGYSNYYLTNSGWAFALARYLPSDVAGVLKTGALPEHFELFQNYPNPFNPNTAISYQLSAVSNVTLKVYDILGREVATLVNEKQNAGRYSVTFDGSRLASGVYFYRLAAGNFVAVKKLVLVK